MMNAFGLLVLVTCVVKFLVSLVANILNISALSPVIPDECKGIYDAEEYKKSQEYTLAKTMFSQCTSVFSLVTFIALWWFGEGFNRVDLFARSISDHYIAQGLVFVFSHTLIDMALSLPFSIYETFVLEERFGFNKTTVKTFVTDYLKSIVLLVLLNSPIQSVVLWFFSYAGENAWIYCWATLSFYQVMFQFIAPIWIMPWFITFTPLADGPLKESINEFAKKVDFQFQGIYEIDGSKRSSHSNAFFTGFGSSKRIALFDTLIKELTIEQVVAVLAHEIGHYKKRHVLITMAISIVNSAIVLKLISVFISFGPLFEAFYISSPSIHIGLLLGSLMYSPISFFTTIAFNMISRKHEFKADQYSLEHCDGNHLAEGLKLMSKKNLVNLTPHPFYSFLGHSHPPMLQRLRAMEKFASKKK